MRNIVTPQVAVSLAFLLSGSVTWAGAVIYSDFGPGFASESTTNGPGWCVTGNTTPNCGPMTDRWIAAPFTPSSTSTLQQLDLALGYSSGTSAAVIDLVNDAGGLPGTSVLESWTPAGLTTNCFDCATPLVTLPSTGGVVLNGGTRYWVLAKGAAPDTLDFWWGNTLGLSGTFSSLNDGASWFLQPGGAGTLTAFDAIATAPEPWSLPMVGAGFVVMLALRASRRSTCSSQEK